MRPHDRKASLTCVNASAPAEPQHCQHRDMRPRVAMNARTTHTAKSACRMCHGGCGVLVHMVDGAITRIIGDPDSPLNKGLLCPKGMAGAEIVTHPDRLTHPMKRVGARGDGRWARISWDEAYDILADKLTRII